MKISQVQLHQIIKEEVMGLIEALPPGQLGPRGTEPMGSSWKDAKRKARSAEEEKLMRQHYWGVKDSDPEVRGLAGTQSVPKQGTSPETSPEGDTTVPPPLKAPPEGTTVPPGAGGAQTLTPAHGDPLKLSIKSLDPDAISRVMIDYAQDNNLEIGRFLGQGFFSKAYAATISDSKWASLGYGGPAPEIALKVTMDKREAETYERVRQERDKLVAKGAPASILPHILKVQETTTPLLMPSKTGRTLELAEAPGSERPRRLKVYFIVMELLEPLDQEIQVDLFGAQRRQGVKDPEGDKGWRGARKRFIENYLSAANIYSALRGVLGPESKYIPAGVWEDFRDALSSSLVQEALPDPAAARAKTAPHFDLRELGITDEADSPFVPVLKEIEKHLEPLRRKYLEGDPQEDRPNLDGTSGNLVKVHKDLTRIIEDSFKKHTTDPATLRKLTMVLRMRDTLKNFDLPLLMHQMTANVRLPAWHPDNPKKGGSASLADPTDLKSPEAKKAFLRLKDLAKASGGSIQYGDLHGGNLMQRRNGELVVADVGLFSLRPEGGQDRPSGKVVEECKRLRVLAGLILK